MANYTIDKIEYNGDIYNLQDANINISSTYDAETYTVTLIVGSFEDIDNTEY